MFYQGIISSPVGPIQLEGTDNGLRKLSILPRSNPENGQILFGYDEPLKDVVEQLEAYFRSELRDFKVRFDLSDYPEFYKEVWRVLLSIPYGRTRTYGEIAEFLRKPKGARAVGSASAHNPVAIIIPCHRVLGKNGSLTGYAFGTPVKRFLLQLEQPGAYGDQGSLF